jgi:hypothetical protein
MRSEESIGFAAALSGGEMGGAGPEGAWVACRAPRAEGGVQCAVIARLREGSPPPPVGFVLGAEKRGARFESALLPGVGTIFYAAAAFPDGRMDQPFDAGVERINRRA